MFCTVYLYPHNNRNSKLVRCIWWNFTRAQPYKTCFTCKNWDNIILRKIINKASEVNTGPCKHPQNYHIEYICIHRYELRTNTAKKLFELARSPDSSRSDSLALFCSSSTFILKSYTKFCLLFKIFKIIKDISTYKLKIENFCFSSLTGWALNLYKVFVGLLFSTKLKLFAMIEIFTGTFK